MAIFKRVYKAWTSWYEVIFVYFINLSIFFPLPPPLTSGTSNLNFFHQLALSETSSPLGLVVNDPADYYHEMTTGTQEMCGDNNNVNSNNNNNININIHLCMIYLYIKPTAKYVSMYSCQSRSDMSKLNIVLQQKSQLKKVQKYKNCPPLSFIFCRERKIGLEIKAWPPPLAFCTCVNIHFLTQKRPKLMIWKEK